MGQATKLPHLVLLTVDTIGGVWTYAVELAAALGLCGVHVAIASMGAPVTHVQRNQIAGVATATLFESAYSLEWMDDPWRDIERAGAWLLQLEHDLQPDVVHLNQFSFGALPFRAPKLVVAHSCVLSWWQAVHGTAAPPAWDRYRRAVKEGLAGASLVAAPTGAMLRALRDCHGFQGHATVLPNGRSAHAFPPAPKEPVIFAAGRLWDAAKNLIALEAVAPGLPWPVRIAGSLTHPDGSVRVATGVSALGELAPQVLAQHLARAAVYALPARYEPFGLSVLEAALAGCALVLGDIPGLREIWGDAALYAPPDDHHALQQALTRLIDNESLRQDVERDARTRALLLSPERMADAYLEAYAAMLDRGRDTEVTPGRAAEVAPGRAGEVTPGRRFPAQERVCAS